MCHSSRKSAKRIVLKIQLHVDNVEWKMIHCNTNGLKAVVTDVDTTNFQNFQTY